MAPEVILMESQAIMSSIFMLAASTGQTITAQVVTNIIAFFVVLFILNKFAVKPILALLDERKETVSNEFSSIERKQAELDSRLKDYEERLRLIDNEARERTNKAIDEGKRAATEIVAEARRQSEELKSKAVSDIRMEMEKARVELRNDIVRLTLGATEKLLQTELNDDRHKQLVGGFISELENR